MAHDLSCPSDDATPIDDGDRAVKAEPEQGHERVSPSSMDWEVYERGNTLFVDLFYPRSSAVNQVEIGLSDVRAADSILIRYDFERDGWVILQASKFEWDADDEVCERDWQEVAFVQAWAREEKRR